MYGRFPPSLSALMTGIPPIKKGILKAKKLKFHPLDLKRTDKITVIKRIVSEKCDVPMSCFYQVSRGKEKISWARQLAMYLCYELRLGTQDEIGKIFNRDHGTVIHAVRYVNQQLTMTDIKSIMHNEQLAECRALVMSRQEFKYVRGIAHQQYFNF